MNSEDFSKAEPQLSTGQDTSRLAASSDCEAKSPELPATGYDRPEMKAEVPRDQALAASELSYRRLFEAAKDGILILDADTGRITDVNPFLIELLGFSHGEMVGKTVGELSPVQGHRVQQAMLERLQK